MLYESMSMRERMGIVQALRREFGDDSIPENRLAEVGFAYTDENGAQTFTSFETLALNALARPEAEKGNDRWKLPHITLTLDCPAESAIGLRITGRDLRRRLKAFANQLFDAKYPLSNRGAIEYRNIVREVYGPDSSVAELVRHHPILHDDTTESGAAGLVDLDYLVGNILEGYTEEADDLLQQIIGLTQPGERLPQETVQQLLTSLQHLHSKVGDIEENERHFEDELKTNFDASRQEYTSDENGISHKAQQLADILATNGFTTAAEAMRQATTLAQAQAVTAAALRSNEFNDEASASGKEWQMKRKAAHSEQEIQKLATERAQLKNKLKADLRPLRGLDDLLNFPLHYKRACIRKIKELEEVLTTKGDTEIKAITLDTTPDAALDADPGKISGDCTEGKPMEFGKRTGLHNIRVLSDGKHIGNIYLLETETQGEDALPVWHIDAVQIPIQNLRWADFPQLLVEALQPLAEDASVQGITINLAQHHVSNYDYIAQGFMQHFGTDNKWRTHDPIQQLSEVASVCDDDSRHCNVNFDRFDADRSSHYSQPQGANDTQVFLWSQRSDNARAVK